MRKLVGMVAVIAACAAPAMADLLTTKIRITNAGQPGDGNGGVFQIEILEGSLPGVGGVGAKFQTFCVEFNEFFTPGGSYWVETNTVAVHGGAGGGPADPLDSMTAGLYEKWRSLNAGADTETNDDIADLYQLAIWRQEQEIEWDNNRWEKYGSNAALGSPYQNASFNQTAVNNLTSGIALPVDGPNNTGKVRVLNMWVNPNRSGASQDQLIHVPAPGAVMLGIAGIGLVGWMRRRTA